MTFRPTSASPTLISALKMRCVCLGTAGVVNVSVSSHTACLEVDRGVCRVDLLAHAYQVLGTDFVPITLSVCEGAFPFPCYM